MFDQFSWLGYASDAVLAPTFQNFLGGGPSTPPPLRINQCFWLGYASKPSVGGPLEKIFYLFFWLGYASDAILAHWIFEIFLGRTSKPPFENPSTFLAGLHKHVCFRIRNLCVSNIQNFLGKTIKHPLRNDHSMFLGGWDMRTKYSESTPTQNSSSMLLVRTASDAISAHQIINFYWVRPTNPYLVAGIWISFWNFYLIPTYFGSKSYLFLIENATYFLKFGVATLLSN